MSREPSQKKNQYGKRAKKFMSVIAINSKANEKHQKVKSSQKHTLSQNSFVAIVRSCVMQKDYYVRYARSPELFGVSS
jgi:hypothetical protein